MLDTQRMARTRDPKNETIRRNLVSFREFAKLSQEQACRGSGVSLDNLRRYESGKVGAPGSAIRLLAPLYGRTMEHFYMEDPPPADLAKRPAVHLWVIPGMEVDAKLKAQIDELVEKINSPALREKKKRK